jgi:hypothetical protein
MPSSTLTATWKREQIMDDGAPTAYAEITVRIPDDLVRRLGAGGGVERRVLEALALDEFRQGHLSRAELRQLLGFATSVRLDEFLAARSVFGTDRLDDLEREDLAGIVPGDESRAPRPSSRRQHHCPAQGCVPRRAPHQGPDQRRASVSLFIDSSMTLAWYFEDEKTAPSIAVLNRVAEEGAVVPALWRLEVSAAFRSRCGAAASPSRIGMPRSAICVRSPSRSIPAPIGKHGLGSRRTTRPIWNGTAPPASASDARRRADPRGASQECAAGRRDVKGYGGKWMGRADSQAGQWKRAGVGEPAAGLHKGPAGIRTSALPIHER